MVSFKNNFLILCATVLTAVSVSAKDSSSFGETITNTNVTAEEVESAQKASGKVTKVDKTWGFKKDEKGQLRIVLHHSSLPYTP